MLEILLRSKGIKVSSTTEIFHSLYYVCTMKGNTFVSSLLIIGIQVKEGANSGYDGPRWAVFGFILLIESGGM